MHEREVDAIEGQLRLVEVEEALADPVEHGPEEVPLGIARARVREGDLGGDRGREERRAGQHGDDDEPRAPERDGRDRRKREQDHGPVLRGDRESLEPRPRDRHDHGDHRNEEPAPSQLRATPGGELGGEIVAAAQDEDRDAGPLQAQQQGPRRGGQAGSLLGEAGGIDVDEARAVVAERPVGKPLDEARRERGRHDGELHGARGRPCPVGEHIRHGIAAVRLGRRKDLERQVPVAVEGVDALVRRPGAVHNERRTPAAARVGLDDGAGGADRELEARVGRLADDDARVRIEEHGGLVPRRVLELLDHQMAAPRGRGPVDAAERFALLIIADAVEVEAGRPPQEQPATLRRARAGFREEAIDVDEPRVDEDRRGRRQRHCDPLEPERILDHHLGFLDRVAPARDAAQQVAAAQAAVAALQRRLALSEARDPLPQDERPGGNEALCVELELHGDVVPGEPLGAAEVPPQRHRALEEADPERRGHHRQDEAKRDRIEHLRAQRPSCQVNPASEGEDPATAIRQHEMFGRRPVCSSGTVATKPGAAIVRSAY